MSQLPAGLCDVPASERSQDIGCYLDATQAIASLSSESVYWHIYNYAASAEAEAAKVANSTVVNAFNRVWLYTIADRDWHPATGSRAAVIGPIHVAAGHAYTARYMEATFTPGMHSTVHTHSGAEAWYLISGAQCLETPDGTIVLHDGESAVVEEGPPMVLSSVGAEIRRSVLLVLHDTSKPWITRTHDWQSKGLCPK